MKIGTTVYTGSTAGGKLLASAMDDLLKALDEVDYVHGLLVQIGNMSDPFSGANIESGSGIFECPTGKGQELFDKVGNIKTALDTFRSGQLETVYSLSQG